MDSHRYFPELRYLVGTYLHQDWDLDGQTVFEVLDHFVEEESRDTVKGVVEDLAAVHRAAFTEHQLESLLDAYGLGYVPQGDGLDHRRLVEVALHRLQSALGDTELPEAP